MWGATLGKVQRWALFLQQFDILYAHISGETNVIADWLSRSLPDDDEADVDIDAIIVPQFPAEESSTEKSMVSEWLPYVPTRENFEQAYKDVSPQDERYLSST